ncbi:unnamed protein product [Rotaria socialis]
MLSNHLKTLPTFSGNENEDVVQWLTDITDGLNCAEFTDDHKILIISGFINGCARRWLFENLFVLDSWPVFIQEFTKEFAPTLLTEDIVSQVNQCVPVLIETIACYDDSVMIELDDIYPAEDSPSYETFLLNHRRLHSQHILDYIANQKRKEELIELHENVLFSTVLLKYVDENYETEWPEGNESWFIHDERSQRNQFIALKKNKMVPSSTFNIVEDSPPQLSCVCECVSSLFVHQSNEMILLLQTAMCKPETLRKQKPLFNEEVVKHNIIVDFYSDSSQLDTIIVSLKLNTIHSKHSLQSNITQVVSSDINFITLLFFSMVFRSIVRYILLYYHRKTPYLINNMRLNTKNYFDWLRTLAVP